MDPTIGHEQAKKRPCLVIRADIYNQGQRGFAVIVPITSRARDLYWQIPLGISEGGLDKLSYIICDKVRSVSLQRFSPKSLGFVSDFTLAQVEERLKVLLSIVQQE